jgi:hypothetical protein
LENLQQLKTEALIDLLSRQTDIYVRMQTMCAGEEEFARCKLLLRAIHKELEQRKAKGSNINLTGEQILTE